MRHPVYFERHCSAFIIQCTVSINARHFFQLFLHKIKNQLENNIDILHSLCYIIYDLNDNCVERLYICIFNEKDTVGKNQKI